MRFGNRSHKGVDSHTLWAEDEGTLASDALDAAKGGLWPFGESLNTNPDYGVGALSDPAHGTWTWEFVLTTAEPLPVSGVTILGLIGIDCSGSLRLI